MHRANVTKRPVIYNDRLSVLDFRPKKRRLNNKPTTPSPLAIQTPTPTPSTLSETAGSGNASPREEVALTWDAAEFTEDLVEKCATLLLEAVAAGLGVEDESSESESEDGEGEGDAAEVGDADESVEDGEESAARSLPDEEDLGLLPVMPQDDDETDDDWRPAGTPKQKRVPRAERKPRARRKAVADAERRGSTASVKSPATRRNGKSLGEASETDVPSRESTPRSTRRVRVSTASV